MIYEITVDGLTELLKLVRGEVFPFSPGISSHPKSADPQALMLHEGCLELERRGLIARHLEDEWGVTWKPVEQSA